MNLTVKITNKFDKNSFCSLFLELTRVFLHKLFLYQPEEQLYQYTLHMGGPDVWLLLFISVCFVDI